MQPLIELKQIRKSYGELTAVDNVDLTIHDQEKVAIIGPSGSGKSTLLRAINFLETVDSGQIFFQNQEVGYVSKRGTRVLDKPKNICALRSEIGMVFQHFHLFPHMTVLGNVMEGPLTVRGQNKKECEEVAMDMLGKVGLLDKKDIYPATLSGGQKQRVAIARALAMKPRVMLFDEPTSALDPELVGEVFDAIRTLAREGMTMLMVTHQMSFARDMADKIIFMENGSFLAEGSPREFFSHKLENPRIKNFLKKIID